MNEITSENYYQKVLGSWLGRIAGDFIGAPVEFLPYSYIKKRYGNINYFIKPIDLNYVNDDEMYEICALLALEKKGIDLTSMDIAKEWIYGLYTQNFTAEKVALRNLRAGIKPPKSGIHGNIWFDAIGGQMRADIWGQITPGCPHFSKKYAEMDGSISHAGIGIEGEVYVAILIAQAFFEKNIRRNLMMAKKYLPPLKKSLYNQMVSKAIEIHDQYPSDFRRARTALMTYWHKIRWSQLIKSESLLSRRVIIFLNKALSGVHVLPNIGIIVLSLLYGAEDEKDPLGKSICTAAMMGLDTDCNCGNIGAILGAQIGADKIPKKWKAPLKNSFSTFVKGHEKWQITELSKRIATIGEKLVEERGNGIIKII